MSAAMHTPAPEDVEGHLTLDIKRKAARYDFLRDRMAYVAVQPHYRELPKSQRTGWTIRLVTGNDSSFDAAIDTAIAKATGSAS